VDSTHTHTLANNKTTVTLCESESSDINAKEASWKWKINGGVCVRARMKTLQTDNKAFTEMTLICFYLQTATWPTVFLHRSVWVESKQIKNSCFLFEADDDSLTNRMRLNIILCKDYSSS
jgi:hypothetical protein